MHPSAPDDVAAVSEKPPPGRFVPSWAANLLGPTTLVGAVYLVLYQAAHTYYSRFGIAPEQAGLSRDAVAGGLLEFALLYVGLLAPGVLLAVVLSRQITRSRKRVAAMVAAVVLVTGALLAIALIHSRTSSLVLVLALYCPLLGGAGAFVILLLREAAPLFPGSGDQLRSLWVRWLRPLVFVAAFLMLPVLAIQLWIAAGAAGGDVLRSGGSTRAFYVMPIMDLLGVRPVRVSPCLIDLGDDKTPAHLRAAVIIGHNAGRVDLLGVAGSAGFRGVPVGHVARFSVVDSELGPLDLDLHAPNWDTTGGPVPADNLTCGQVLRR